MLAGAQLLVLAASRSGALVRRQTTILIAGGLVPSITQAWWILRPQDFGLDPTPFAFVIAGVASLWALSRLRFLASQPLARDVLFAATADAALAVDPDGC